jgi:hypothetical protein
MRGLRPLARIRYGAYRLPFCLPSRPALTEMNTSELHITQARTNRVADGPTISVLVVSEKTPEELTACLDSLLPVCSRLPAQLVVVRAVDGEELHALKSAYPRVRFVAAPKGASAADMREIAMAAADGDIVCFQRELPVSPHWAPPRASER